MTDARNARQTARVLLPVGLTVRSTRQSVRVAFGIPLVTTPTVKAWNGSTFVDAPVKVYNGSTFVDAVAVKTWNGSAWVP